MYHQVVPLIAALIKAHSPLRITDQVIFALFKLQGINIKLGIYISGIKQKSMGRD